MTPEQAKTFSEDDQDPAEVFARYDAAPKLTTQPPAAPRLTFPAYDQGAADILADGRHVGIALAEFKGWRAYLYPAAQDRRIRLGQCEEVTAGTLRELRRLLRERADGDGPWWARSGR
jgi:hypothetical protein